MKKNKKKILIAYASYGSGHKTIANYIKDHIDQEEYNVKLIDVLDYTGKISNMDAKLWDYVSEYRLEKLYSLVYKCLDNSFCARIYNLYFKTFVLTKSLEEEFCKFKPDLVISAHFFGTDAAYYLNKENKINAKMITIVTDYKAHNFWMSHKYDANNYFVVGNDYVKEDMVNRGVFKSRVYSYGLPINEEKYNNVIGINEILKKYKISKEKPIILFFGGGSNGSKAYFKYLKQLLKKDKNSQVLFVCGKNEKLKTKVENLKVEWNSKNLRVLGFIENVYELLTIADFVITKPGGATVTECLETQKPMLLIPGLGGQESYNAEFVNDSNYGVNAKNIIKYKKEIKNYVNDNDYFKQYDYKKYKKNHSLVMIEGLVHKLIGGIYEEKEDKRV